MEGVMRVAARSARPKLSSRQIRLHPVYLIRPELFTSNSGRARRPSHKQPSVSAYIRPHMMQESPTETTSLLGRVDVTELSVDVQQNHAPQGKVFGCQDNPTTTRDCYSTFHSFDDGTVCEQIHHPTASTLARISWNTIPESAQRQLKSPREIAAIEARSSARTIVEPVLSSEELQISAAKGPVKPQAKVEDNFKSDSESTTTNISSPTQRTTSGMSDQPPSSEVDVNKSPAKQHRPLVVGRTKPQSPKMDPSATEPKVLNEETKQDVEPKIPAEGTPNPPAGKKKEKAPKQPKAPKAAPPTAPLSPALIDLRVGHILRAINHPNADSLYVSTIAMGDAEGTDHTQVDEETGKVVRTVCSGLNGLVPLEEMQNRKIVVVANLKPVNMRSIKSAAMVLAASPPAKEGADPHAADRVVELVTPPEGAEAGDPVFFEGWEYGEGKGPEKTLNPKKKQWEAIQPGFFTSEDLVVGFDAGKSEVEGDKKGDLIVQGKGKCTVKTLKGAVVR